MPKLPSKPTSTSASLPAAPRPGGALLTRADFHQLAHVPAEAEWFANIDNPRTRRAYEIDLKEFMRFVGITHAEDFRTVARSHVIAWRKDLEQRALSGASIRRKLAALSSLFEYLCEQNAVTHNPVKGVKRPKVETYEGKTPALGDHQARALLAAPKTDTLKGRRDRAILSVFLHHALRREELATLKVKDMHERRGVKHFRVHGKGGKLRYVPIHAATLSAIDEYLELAGHKEIPGAPLFRPVKNNVSGTLTEAMTPGALYDCVVKYYAKKIGLEGSRLGPHALRATAATNALDNGADIAKVQEWLGHANIATTRIYDHRKMRPEDSPTFKVAY